MTGCFLLLMISDIKHVNFMATFFVIPLMEGNNNSLLSQIPDPYMFQIDFKKSISRSVWI